MIIICYQVFLKYL